MKKPIIAIIVVAALLPASLAVFLKSPDPIGDQLRALHQWGRLRRPRTFVDYFKPATLEWYLHGRPNLLQQQKRVDEHYQGLIVLGYLETRDFKLANRSADTAGMQEFYSLTTNITFSDYHARWSTVPGNPS